MSFRENLKSLMIYKGIKMKELAEMSGVKKTTLESYLSAREQQPLVEAAVKIARALNVSVEWLVTGEGTKHHQMASQQTVNTPVDAASPGALHNEQNNLLGIAPLIREAGGLSAYGRKTLVNIAKVLRKQESEGANPAIPKLEKS